MNLLSSVSASLILLGMVSLPLPVPGTQGPVSGGPDQSLFLTAPKESKENAALIKVIVDLQSARTILRSA